jgi:citrate synthase
MYIKIYNRHVGVQPVISADEAAQLLGVKPATVYAYVSRGLLHSHRRPGSRQSWFDARDVGRLAASRGQGRDRRPEVAISTAVARVDGSRLWYRDHDAVELAATRSFEEVCQYLWSGELALRPFQARPEVVSALRRAVRPPVGARPLDALAITVATAGALDPLRYDLAPHSVASTGRSLIACCAEPLSAPPRKGAAVAPVAPVAMRLWAKLGGPASAAGWGPAVLDSILVLLADHELATSTLAARLAASTRADPYAVVSAGLAVLHGPLHGTASSEDVVPLLVAADGAAAPGPAISERLRRGSPLSGFGHRVYEHGDPRAVFLLSLLESQLPPTEETARKLDVIRAVRDAVVARSGLQPNVDFGLGAFVYAAGLEKPSGELIFAVARTAGWLAHAIEEYQEEPLRFRSRAVPRDLPPDPGPSSSRSAGRPAPN